MIFLTAKTDNNSIAKGFKLGGVDYITKPFNKAELLARVKTHLELKDYKNNLEEKVLNLTKEIEDTQKEVIFTLACIGEKRSQETSNHVKRVAKYSRILASHVGLSKYEINLVYEASPMHDIGKIGISDSILNKKGSLNKEEWAVMKTHAQLGFEMLKHSSRPILKAAAIIAVEHHEKFDGTGYPNGLKGDKIHIYGRITAIADVFDALSSDRVYKKSWKDKDILDLFRTQRGKHFDPNLIDIFFNNLDEFYRVRDKFKDLFTAPIK
ncbi:MAG: HD domain-containing protein [Sulfurospirillum sp.]|nr:HD domain-containing protein [Sulfurospirillum sp.]MBL0703177.1 HD domain-containing protein [Sulfurospirillum sp.]